MRIEELHLLAFGPFTGRTLEFSGTGLNVIFGPNEAGKSSALRAIDSLLFGIPAKTSDDFIHPYNQLRIGAKLSNRKGEMVSFARRKKRRPFVSFDESEKVLPDDLLDGFLCGLEQKRFQEIYCIDHVAMRAGGELMRKLKGFADESLLVASNSAELPQLQGRLQSDLDSLFLPRGRKNRIKLGVAAYQAAKKEKTDHEVRVSRWTQLSATLEDREAKKAELRNDTAGLRQKQSRLARLRDALPKIAKWRSIGDKLAGRKARILPEDYSVSVRQQCEAELRSIEDRIRDCSEELKATQERLRELKGSPIILKEAAAIEQLQQRIDSQAKGAEEKRQVQAEAAGARKEVERLLVEIDTDTPFDQVESLRLRREHRAALLELAEAEKSLREKKRSLAVDLDRCQSEVARLTAELAACGPAADIAQLENALHLSEQVRELKQACETMQAQQNSQLKAAELALAALPGWEHSLTRLVSAELPLRESVDRFGLSTLRLAEKLESGVQRLQEAKRSLRKVEQEIDATQRTESVATEVELAKLRDDRDACLRQIQTGREGESGGAPKVGWRESLSDLANRIKLSDEMSDRLRREADRVAELAQRRALAHSLTQQIQDQETELEGMEAEQASLFSNWNSAWSEGGMNNPLSATEMAAWLDQRDLILGYAQNLRRMRLEELALQKDLQQAQASLTSALGDSENLTVSPSHIEVRRQSNNERAQLEKDLARLQLEVEGLVVDVSRAEYALKTWQQDWSGAVGWIGCDPDATSALVRARIECLDELAQRFEHWTRQSNRADSIDHDAADFSKQLTAVANRVKLERGDTSPLEAAQQLKSNLDQARQVEQQVQACRDAINIGEKKIKELRVAQERNQKQLKELLHHAGVDSHASLPEAETLSHLARQLQDLGREIEQMSGGAGLDAFVAEASNTNVDTLAANLAQLDEEIQEKVNETDLTVAQIADVKREMDAIDGNAAAAEADQRAMNCLANVHEASRRYAKLKIAQSLLQQHIERYQEENRDPLLEQASRYFSTMTCNEFVGLQVDYDDHGKPIIQGVRKGRSIVDVAAMSDGTRDPMFLALRLAYLQKRLGPHEPMPFIVDDILIHLDDERAAATLQVLAELSEHTQVLFFTHHNRLRELAEQYLPSAKLQVHELERVSLVST